MYELSNLHSIVTLLLLRQQQNRSAATKSTKATVERTTMMTIPAMLSAPPPPVCLWYPGCYKHRTESVASATMRLGCGNGRPELAAATETLKAYKSTKPWTTQSMLLLKVQLWYPATHLATSPRKYDQGQRLPDSHTGKPLQKPPL